MEGSNEKVSQLIPHYKIWITDEHGNGILGDGKWKILKAVVEHGSLVAACKALGITYRRTWGDLQTISKQLGFPLLATSRGGRDGGCSVLSPQGECLVKAFDRFHASTDATVNEALQNFLNEVKTINSND